MQLSSLPRPVQQIHAAPAALLAKVLPLLARETMINPKNPAISSLQ